MRLEGLAGVVEADADPQLPVLVVLADFVQHDRHVGLPMFDVLGRLRSLKVKVSTLPGRMASIVPPSREMRRTSRGGSVKGTVNRLAIDPGATFDLRLASALHHGYRPAGVVQRHDSLQRLLEHDGEAVAAPRPPRSAPWRVLLTGLRNSRVATTSTASKRNGPR